MRLSTSGVRLAYVNGYVYYFRVFNLVIGKATPVCGRLIVLQLSYTGLWLTVAFCRIQYMVESLDYGFFFLYAAFLTCSCFFTYFVSLKYRDISARKGDPD